MKPFLSQEPPCPGVFWGWEVLPAASQSPLQLQGFSWEPSVPGEHRAAGLDSCSDPRSLEARNGASFHQGLVIAQGLASKSSWGGQRGLGRAWRCLAPAQTWVKAGLGAEPGSALCRGLRLGCAPGGGSALLWGVTEWDRSSELQHGPRGGREH